MKTLVFIRRGQNRRSHSEELGDKDGNEIWSATVQDSTPPQKLFGGDPDHGSWIGLAEPRLSQDGKFLYFEKWFGNGYSLYSLSLGSGELKQLAGTVDGFWTVCSGTFRNSIVVQEDHLKLAGGHLSLYWLYTPEGVRQDLVGTTKEDLTLFLRGDPGQ